MYTDFLPGYVFVFSEKELKDYSVFFGIDGVIRKVGQADEKYELQGSDREFAMELLEKDGVVGGMRTVRSCRPDAVTLHLTIRRPSSVSSHTPTSASPDASIGT